MQARPKAYFLRKIPASTCLSASSSVLSCKVDQLYSSFPAEVTQYTTSQVEPIPLLHEFETYIPLIPALGSLPQIP